MDAIARLNKEVGSFCEISNDVIKINNDKIITTFEAAFLTKVLNHIKYIFSSFAI